MQFGVSFPQDRTIGDPGALREFAQAVEGLGFEYLTISDHDSSKCSMVYLMMSTEPVKASGRSVSPRLRAVNFEITEPLSGEPGSLPARGMSTLPLCRRPTLRRPGLGGATPAPANGLACALHARPAAGPEGPQPRLPQQDIRPSKQPSGCERSARGPGPKRCGRRRDAR